MIKPLHDAKRVLSCLASFVFLFIQFPSSGQNTPQEIFHLPFDGTSTSTEGEVSTWNFFFPGFGTYKIGKIEEAQYVSTADYLAYLAPNNINSQQGTLEFWLQPGTNWVPNGEFTILDFGGSGGMLFEKDAANNLRLIINRHSLNGQPEVDVAFNQSWTAGQWYHIAYTWGSDTLRLYVNGTLVDQDVYEYPFPNITNPSFNVGFDGTMNFGGLDAYMDDLIIYDSVKTSSQIQDTYQVGLNHVNSTNSCNTLLYLPFNNSLLGDDGEIPYNPAGIVYAAGTSDQGVDMKDNSVLVYEKANNFNETKGTLEFWINPNNVWVPEGEYSILTVGGAGGMIFAKDGANNLRLIVNRLSINNQPELDVAYNVWQWDMNEWYHVAYTWGDKKLKLYVNGILVDQDEYVGYDIPTFDATYFQIGDGSEWGTGTNRFLLDELSISDCVKSGAQIMSDYLSVPIVTPPVTSTCSPLFYLNLDFSLVGEDGEMPIDASGINFVPGRISEGVDFTTNTELRYEKANNFNELEGSLEFWVNSHNNWQYGEEYTILECGGAGGMIFEKDGANNLRLIINRFSVNGQPEVDVAYNVWQWNLNEWYHVAYTWGNGDLYLYVNGVLVDSDHYGTYSFPAISATYFRIGDDDVHGEGPLRASLDEIMISGCIQSAAEIDQHYQNGRMSTTTSVLASGNQSGFQPFPNPADEFVSFNLANSTAANTKIEIEDQTGKSILSREITGNGYSTLDISEIPAGLYFVKIFSGEIYRY